MKIAKKLSLKIILIFVIVVAMIEFLTVSFISFQALRGARSNQDQTLFLLIGINLSMVVLFIVIMALVMNAFNKINYYAFTSSITGLPNKNFVLNNLIDEISQIEKFSALMSLDMDNFKAVNDSLGHLAGDQLLRHAGRRFRTLLSDDDCVCHIGGDEFLFFIRSTKRKSDIEKLASDIIGLFKTPFHISGKTVDFVTASIGIAVIPDNGHDFESLYNEADDAMYAAKTTGKNKYFFYDKNISLHIYENTIRKKEISDGIQNREFKVYYQPKFSYNGTLIGAEALVRWFKKNGKMLLPSDFIGFAEQNGVILELSNLVIEEVCKTVLQWIDKGYANFSIAINLTAEHLINQEICRNLISKIQACQVPPHMIEFEITESMIISDFKTAAQNINMMKSAGIKVSLDDFGTGYSSLNYLKNLPIDYVKIDKSFIDTIPDNAKDLALLKSILDIAHNLGYKVVAEGVESEKQMKTLKEIRCDMFQGYYFGKPVDNQTFEQNFLKCLE